VFGHLRSIQPRGGDLPFVGLERPDSLSFLTPLFNVGVTNNPLTSQVASGLLQGFYPGDTGKAHEVLIQPAAIDSLEPRYSCPRADALRTSFTTGPNGSAWKEHLQTVQGDGTFAALDGVSGIRPDDGEWHVSLDQ
jgi:acid phosphatase